MSSLLSRLPNELKFPAGEWQSSTGFDNLLTIDSYYKIQDVRAVESCKGLGTEGSAYLFLHIIYEVAQK